MMKKALPFILLFFLLGTASQAAKLYKIRLGYYPEKIRIVLDLDSEFSYKLDESKEKIIVHLPKCEATGDIQNYIDFNDIIIRYLEVEKEDDGLKVSIPLYEPVPYNIFYLSDPDRLVIDFNREYTNLISGGTIIDGLEHLKVLKSTPNGRVISHVLKIDPSKVDTFPALARKDKANAFSSFINLLNPWKEAPSNKHFFRARVGTIAEDQGAIAAINGTYFAYTGKPLGTLLIDKELVSSPVYNRTALILTDDRQAIIDNILIDCYFKTKKGVRYNITGVNQGQDGASIVLYTPAWGEKTGTNNNGIELIISGSVVKEIKNGDSTIPPDGYVLSICGPASQFLTDNVKAGDKLDVHIQIAPYASSPKSILHMISGGPRLLKSGIPYVSKNEEKFKADIANGRAARTAIGITKEGKLLFVTVDGLPRQKSQRGDKVSIGVTLEELSDLMLNLGAVDAMNLDGGSSTTMWIDGRVVNQPVSGSAVSVSNAIVVAPR
ncbi:MAG: phosphodiester glycosidase family protein [bacterium]